MLNIYLEDTKLLYRELKRRREKRMLENVWSDTERNKHKPKKNYLL